MAAGTNGKAEFEGDGGNAGVSSDVNACIGVYPLASAQTARGLFPAGPGDAREHRRGFADDLHQREFAPTIFVHGTKDGTVPVQSSVDFFTKLHGLGRPVDADAHPGRRSCVRQQRAGRRRVDGASIDLFLDRLIINPKPYPSFGGGGGGRGGGGRGRGGPAPGGRG